MYNLYDSMFKKQRAKMLKEYRLSMHWIELNQAALSQFEYTGLPETVPAEWIEGFMISNGTVGVGELDGKLYACMGGYAGNVNGYLPDKYYGAVQGIGTLEGDAVGTATNEELQIGGVVGKDIVVGWNNAMLAPDMDIIDTAARLTESDTSEDLNILFSRLLRIPIARNDKEKEIIKTAIQSILEGKIDAVSSALSLNEIVSGQKDEMQFLDLVDIKDVDKLQYLNQYHDNIMKRFYQRHGHAMQITSKLAQQTNAEIHGADTISMIYPLQQLKYRKKFCENLNKTFGEKYGFNCSVEFSELWKNNYDQLVNYQLNEDNEEVIKGEGEEIEKGNSEDNRNNGNTDADAE